MEENSLISPASETIPLLVDLDGSLVGTDTLYEMVATLIRSNPIVAILIPFWLIRGKSYLKQELFHRVKLNVDALPYREEVIDYLRLEHKCGRRIILVTGSWHKLAEQICDKFDFFDDCAGTDDNVNLTGRNKANWANETYGKGNYDYLGNEEKDLLVWEHARKSIVVGNKALLSKALSVSELGMHINIEKAGISTYLRAIRVHQWPKNALVFVPLFAAQLATDISSIFLVTLGFLAFCCCASGTYIFNDIFDLDFDRQSSIKRSKPIASGKLAIPKAVFISTILLALSIAIALALNKYFLGVLVSYFVVASLYSYKLKSLQTVDVIALAGLSTLRIIAGAAAISVPLSFWLMSFSMVLFFSLAIARRVSEILSQEQGIKETKDKVSEYGYYLSDIPILQSLGSASGLISIIMFAQYISSDQAVGFYRNPQILWLVCPVLGYWIVRIWMLTARGQMNRDSISFAITDRNSVLAGLLIGLIFTLASA